ncbi:MAG: hypothetical protein CMP91_10830 [Gammaproteobacteria bacterium]|nr:hypothetical protein [Gammaproteobacteria bacterium]|tara:strand:- start:1121 stop:1318 length:198 start_codon:yes stop_codon:yes gene_type:complete
MVLSGLALLSASGQAQDNDSSSETRPSMQAQRIPAGMTIELDGFLDEQAWSLAQAITQFRQQEPV